MSRTVIVRAVAVLAVLPLLGAGVGCTTNPYTGKPEISKTAWGALIGAGVGAAVGAAVGDNGRERKKAALIGAGAGAIAGGSVGAYMDYQEAKLREQLERTGVGIERIGDDIVLIMPGNVTFETDRSDVRASFYEVLDSVALVLEEYDKTVVEVAGHTDATGSEEHNLALSRDRASSVATYLRNRGVYEKRLLALGFGEAEPIASNDTPEGREANRRVEITLLPLVAEA
jgi:outer membrane protein OmpA-like peptidoglycan-associated protein